MADYQNLAQIAQPQMMPNAPIGAGGTAGWMYGSDKARQDQFLMKAAEQAKLKAQMEGMDAEEKAAGHAGRMTLADLGNVQATDKADAYSQFGKETLSAEAEAKLEKIRKELDMDTVNSLAATEDPQEAAAILSRAKVSGGLRSRSGRDMADLPPEAAMKLAKKLMVNTPKHQQEMAKEGVKQAGATARTLATQAGQDRRAAILAKVRQDIAAAQAAKAANKPLTMSQREALAADEMYKDDAEGLLKYMLVKESAGRLPEAQARAGTAQGMGVPVDTPQAITPPTPNPKPKSVPTIPELGKMHKGKKVVKREGKANSNEVRITYEDGTTEIIK